MNLALAAVLSFILAGPAQETRRDGNWWNGRDEIGKLAYAVGFLDGLDLGSEFSKPVLKLDSDGKFDPALLRERDAINERFNQQASKYFGQVKAGQLVDGLDAFYKDFRNRSILVTYAVDIVVREIAGEDAEQLIIGRRRYR